MGFLNALSAIGGLAGGVAEGEQARAARENQKQEALARKATMVEGMSSSLRNQVLNNPELATNPNWIKMVQHVDKTYGLGLPWAPDGSLDISAFAPKPDIMEAMGGDPSKLAAIKNLPSDAQRALAKKFSDPSGLLGDFSQEPTVSPAEDIKLVQSLNEDLIRLTQGNFDAGKLDLTLGLYAKFLPKGTLDGIVNANPEVLGKLGVNTMAKLENLAQMGAIHKEDLVRLKAEVANFGSIADFRKFQEKHFQNMDAVQRGHLEEQIYNDRQRSKEAEQRIAISSSRLKLETKKAAANGITNVPLTQLRKDEQATRAFVGTLQSERNSLLSEIKALTTSGDDVPDEVLNRKTELDTAIEKYQGILDTVTENRINLSNAALRAAGVNVKTTTAPGSTYGEDRQPGKFSNGTQGYRIGPPGKYQYFNNKNQPVDENGNLLDTSQ